MLMIEVDLKIKNTPFSQVIKHNFKWVEERTIPPTKKDIMNVLKQEYLITLKTTKKNVENAQVVDDSELCTEDPKKQNVNNEEEPMAIQTDKVKQDQRKSNHDTFCLY